MRLDEDTLVEQLKMVAQTGTSPSASVGRRGPAAPPVTEKELLTAEAALGFVLPPLLRRLYLEVSNGDFGPLLLRLDEEHPLDGKRVPDSLVGHHLAWRSITQEELDAAWGDTDNDDRPTILPQTLLMIHDWGCNIYSYLDCSRTEYPVLRNDNNISFRTFAHESPSLHQWLEDWLEGKQLFYLDWEHSEKVTLPFG